MLDRGQPLGSRPPARYLSESAEAYSWSSRGHQELQGSPGEEGGPSDWLGPYQPHPGHRSLSCPGTQFSDPAPHRPDPYMAISGPLPLRDPSVPSVGDAICHCCVLLPPDTGVLGKDRVGPALAGESLPLFTKHPLCVQPSADADLSPTTTKLGSLICPI